MADSNTKGARLLPKDLWSRCSECEGQVPEFEFSESFKARLDEMMFRQERVGIHKALQRESGCDFVTAKIWVLHKTYKIVPKPSAYCPDCGARLQTAKAKQCWKCKKDWHT